MIYACVVRDNQIIHEYSKKQGNMQSVAQEVLNKAPAHYKQLSLNFRDEHHVHFEKADGIAYLVVAESTYPRRLAYNFLLELRELYTAEEDPNFAKQIEAKVNYYNSDEVDKITKVRRNLEDINAILLENIEKIIERGIRVETLEAKVEIMDDTASNFYGTSRRLRRAMCWQKYKWYVICSIIAILVIVVLSLIIWGATKDD